MNKTTLALTLLVLVPGMSRADTLESAFAAAVAAAASAAQDAAGRLKAKQPAARAASFPGRWILANKDFPKGILMPDGQPAFVLVIHDDGKEKYAEFVSRDNIPGWQDDYTSYPVTVKDGVASFPSHHHCVSLDGDNVSCRRIDARHLRCEEPWADPVKSYDFVLGLSR